MSRNASVRLWIASIIVAALMTSSVAQAITASAAVQQLKSRQRDAYGSIELRSSELYALSKTPIAKRLELLKPYGFKVTKQRRTIKVEVPARSRPLFNAVMAPGALGVQQGSERVLRCSFYPTDRGNERRLKGRFHGYASFTKCNLSGVVEDDHTVGWLRARSKARLVLRHNPAVAVDVVYKGRDAPDSIRLNLHHLGLNLDGKVQPLHDYVKSEFDRHNRW